jgi:hypothetical protein
MDHDETEWRCALAELTELERAHYDTDTMDAYGGRP